MSESGPSEWGSNDKGLPVGENLRHSKVLEKNTKVFSTSSTTFYSFSNLLLPTLSIFSAGFWHQRQGSAQGLPAGGILRRFPPTGKPSSFGFWFLVCYAATQLANQLHQTRIQVVRRNKVARKHLTESNGTPAMDLGHMNVVLKWYYSYV